MTKPDDMQNKNKKEIFSPTKCDRLSIKDFSVFASPFPYRSPASASKPEMVPVIMWTPSNKNRNEILNEFLLVEMAAFFLCNLTVCSSIFSICYRSFVFPHLDFMLCLARFLVSAMLSAFFQLIWMQTSLSDGKKARTICSSLSFSLSLSLSIRFAALCSCIFQF